MRYLCPFVFHNLQYTCIVRFMSIFFLFTVSLWINTWADLSIFKRAVPNTGEREGSNYMSPFICIGRPKKRGGTNPRNPLHGSTTVLCDLFFHSTVFYEIYVPLFFILQYFMRFMSFCFSFYSIYSSEISVPLFFILL